MDSEEYDTEPPSKTWVGGRGTARSVIELEHGHIVRSSPNQP